ncbi:MAG: DUF6473 family protein [Sulfitobacter sp.]
MTYDMLGPGALDYLPCRYGKSKIAFRGPRRTLDDPYVAFIGGTETYGKFIENPFPDLIEQATGLTSVNFGLLNAGIDVFSAERLVLETAARARANVVQVMGAQNMSNRFYTVHPRRNDRFLSASDLLQSIYPEVDFAEFHFTKHMLQRLWDVSPQRFAPIRRDLQAGWLARMRMLLRQLGGHSILLWFAGHAPAFVDAPPGGLLGPDPLFVTGPMLDKVAPLSAGLVKVIASPQAQAAGTQGMIFAEMESLAAQQILGPLAHEEVAQALLPALAPLLNPGS